MKHAYLVTFESDRTVQTEDRGALKDFLGDYLRATHGIDAPVSIDHLDADEPSVLALLRD
jgi:hypothetical protein